MSDTINGREFPQTRWTLVSLARNPDDSQATKALNQICERYWYPVYAFIRLKGSTPEEAQDRTQDFFLSISSHLAKADRKMGRLRTFFLTILQRNIVNEYRRRNAQIRGGGVEHLSLDADRDEERYCAEPEDKKATVEDFFEYVWAKEIFLGGLDRVGKEWEARGQGHVFEVLKPLILRPAIELDLSVTKESACSDLAIKDENCRKKISDIRKRLNELVAEEIAETLTDPKNSAGQPSEKQIAKEVAQVFSVLITNTYGKSVR